MSVVLVDKYIVWAPSAFDNRRPKLKGNYSFVLHGGVPKGTGRCSFAWPGSCVEKAQGVSSRPVEALCRSRITE